MIPVELAAGRAHLRPEPAHQRYREGLHHVTSQPSPCAVAATSAPMNPAPTTTTRGDPVGQRGPEREDCRRESAARRCPPAPAARAGGVPHAPVAMTRPSIGHRRAVAQARPTRRPGRARSARTPSRRSSSERVEVAVLAQARCARVPTRRRAPSSTAAGGRTGRWSSAPTKVIRPVEALRPQRLSGAQARPATHRPPPPPFHGAPCHKATGRSTTRSGRRRAREDLRPSRTAMARSSVASVPSASIQQGGGDRGGDQEQEHHRCRPRCRS